MEVGKKNNGAGGLKLPIGFRFRPTDEELVVHYLKRKVSSLPLPASVIPELDVHHTNPSDLPSDPREKRYFFSRRSASGNKRSRSSRTAASGHWRAIGKEKRISASAGSIYQTVGLKKLFVFRQGKRPHCLRTQWFMAQYYLLGSGTNPNQRVVEDWVVSCIYRKERKGKNDQRSTVRNRERDGEVIVPNNMKLMMMMEDSTQSGPLQPSPASSCSSGITEVSSSSDEFNQEADSSAELNFLP